MKIFKMIRGFFLKRSRSYKIMQCHGMLSVSFPKTLGKSMGYEIKAICKNLTKNLQGNIFLKFKETPRPILGNLSVITEIKVH